MRWLNRDPIEEDGGGINLYAFCGNNSMTTIDYLGTTKIGEILSSFFDKDLGPLLWIMYGNDEYTAIVRDWESVVKNVNIIKNIVYRNNDIWRKKHTTTKSWRPNMNGQFDSNKGYYHIETSPNGTDPNTAKTHFILYNLTFIQTKTLHTSAIGSFHIFATLDSIKKMYRTNKYLDV